MNTKISVLFLIIGGWSLSIQAQDFSLPSYQVSLSYFGEMVTHGGIRLGVATPLSQKNKEKTDGQFVNKAWVLGGYLTYYKHPRNHTGLMFTGSIGRQRIGKKGFQTSIHFETGYMFSRLDGEVFEWDGEDIVEGKKGSSHIILGFNGGLGWNFTKTSDFPFSFMVQPHLYIQAPYNTLFAPRVALETKIAYQLK